MTATPVVSLLAEQRWPEPSNLAHLALDRPGRGAVAARCPTGARRAEPGPAGPLVLEARAVASGSLLQVWGPPDTSEAAIEAALAAGGDWLGVHDDPSPLADTVACHPVLSRLLRETGEVRLSRVPRVGEAVGRAILAQLVQTVEARRSTAQLAALAGTPAAGGLWSWPTAQQVGSTPAWTLRRCGISLRGAGALHASAVSDAALTAAARDWPLLDRRLRSLPGIGIWTSAEARLALGDPDAVPVGDYNLPAVIGRTLGGAQSDRVWDDAAMLELLAPYAGQRGRVIRLVTWAAFRGRAARPPRRAPRAALSRHRYW